MGTLRGAVSKRNFDLGSVGSFLSGKYIYKQFFSPFSITLGVTHKHLSCN